MKTKELTERYITLVIGLFFMSIGIAMSIHANLGITPISCPPYVLSLGLSPTVGQFTIIMHVLMILAQLVLLGKNFPRLQYMQLAMAFVFGFFIDLSVWLTSSLIPNSYAMRVIYIILGSAILAFGIVLEVGAKVMLIAGEGLMLAISKVFKKPFGKIKIVFDCSLILISLIFSLFMFGEIKGVREGTIISALLVGFFVGRIQPYMTWLEDLLNRNNKKQTKKSTAYSVVTISRRFGSGGHEIGKRLAERLGWDFYDRDLINMTVEKSGLTTTFVEQHEQKLSSSQTLWRHITMDNFVAPEENLSPDDCLFVEQSKIIRHVAQEKPCVIVGRLSDYVLGNDHRALHVFVTSTLQFAVERIVSQYNYDTEKATLEIARINKLRSNHYKYYTHRKWGDPGLYDLYIESSSTGIDMAVDTIEKIVRNGKK